MGWGQGDSERQKTWHVRGSGMRKTITVWAFWGNEGGRGTAVCLEHRLCREELKAR